MVNGDLAFDISSEMSRLDLAGERQMKSYRTIFIWIGIFAILGIVLIMVACETGVLEPQNGPEQNAGVQDGLGGDTGIGTGTGIGSGNSSGGNPWYRHLSARHVK